MYELYLQNGDINEKVFGGSLDDIWDYINRWLNRNNYHAYYFRQWTKNGKTYIDFGSWSILFWYREVE